ncbi:sugar transferase [Teredinibacter purpureus]|uniref:sugar transferase n=1 Tax=Teredinibacter purpureus TaxID=2731756 RepID=UPI000697C412|nr:sugar transferase [Teredinibacter purpureus]
MYKLTTSPTSSQLLLAAAHDIIDNTFQPGLPLFIQQATALLAIIALSPLLLLVIAAIKFESRGNAVFTQIRVGENGETFTLYKFRSMYLPSDPKYVDTSTIDSDRDGVCKKFFHDPRITPIGRIIRKLSIDELPQLLNVVRGEMGLVGPRPALPAEVAAYDAKARLRLNTKPGLTGLWQISGRADTTFDEQINLDLRYIEEKSLFNDIKIIALTIPAVVTGRGAY